MIYLYCYFQRSRNNLRAGRIILLHVRVFLFFVLVHVLVAVYYYKFVVLLSVGVTQYFSQIDKYYETQKAIRFVYSVNIAYGGNARPHCRVSLRLF